MPNPSLHRHFVQWALAACLALLLSAAFFNYFIDPYDLFGSPRIEGINRIKPTAGTHVRQAKPYSVSRFAPYTVIGGNSRPEMGLDPRSACWAEQDQPVFNMGVPGASVFMQARMLQHAIEGRGGQEKQVYWGLDFMDFLSTHRTNGERTQWPGSRRSFEKRLSVTATGQPNGQQNLTILKDMASTLFSIDTLQDGLYTLISQGNDRASSRREDGFNPARDYLDIIATEGQRVLFLQKNRELANSFSNRAYSIFEDGRTWSYDFETVSRIIDYLQQRHTTVTLFINPYHADYLSLIDLSGRWLEFEQWKRRLQQLADDKGVVFWDFALLNDYTSEQLPAGSGKGSSLQWFWEPAHYKAEYGDLMLQQILERTCLPGSAQPVGMRLTAENIGSHLNQQRRRMDRYMKKNHQTIALLRSYLSP